MDLFVNFYDLPSSPSAPDPVSQTGKIDEHDALYLSLSTADHPYYCGVSADRYIRESGGILGAIAPLDRLRYLVNGTRLEATPSLQAVASSAQREWEARRQRPQLPAEELRMISQVFLRSSPNYPYTLCTGITNGWRLENVVPPETTVSTSVVRRSPRSRRDAGVPSENPIGPQRILPGVSNTGRYEIVDGGVRRVD